MKGARDMSLKIFSVCFRLCAPSYVSRHTVVRPHLSLVAGDRCGSASIRPRRLGTVARCGEGYCAAGGLSVGAHSAGPPEI